MNKRIKISYGHEHLAAGESVTTPWAFWTGLKLDSNYDPERLATRLREIYDQNGIHSEVLPGDVFYFAPRFKVEVDDSLEWN